ncbi:S-layer homology domain-containing protein [Paenibacillus apiarius]|uniref:S-layer homology domain-containing protein n=1 Tax=Paenibacillus apiarius TaxID=46240 RepID=A0ABT4DMH5_9BACL|nr:S-layer homology domain-containing protein [Paenibacillus apiarius]MCY9514566.1 S-layer homology domain-containing protein [Paenibacillus apiarius]MCY9518556.1 S-layer homology domain-containing protein [Paenibacillus apiarius]MCY9552644.1 S-layer homology domain-containing protein [Paenibacillus apiarius]MCY9557028.1 S-layer homology domain-containing protein [Paenibacillus apiarius]MCY9686019.1 S-layer homology domain-containing protein [Paenibacillus apiarius]
MKRFISALLCLMLILTAHSGSVQAKGNNVSAVSEQQYTRIGEDYDILDENILLSKKDGTVWFWDFFGVPLHASDPFYKAKLMQIPGLQDVKQFSFEGEDGESRFMTNYAALKKDGTVWYWDFRNKTYLKDSSRTTPKRIKDLDHVTSLVADYSSNYQKFKTLYVLKSDGSVWCWVGRLGKASSTAQYKLLDDVVSIKSADRHVYAVKKDGSVWQWEAYMYWPQNQFKNEGPQQIKGLVDIVNIEMGGWTNYAYKKDGTVWSWPMYEPESIPIQLHKATGVRGFVPFSSQSTDSNDTTYALRKDDKLWSIDSGKVFPGLSNIASVHHKDKGIQMGKYVFKNYVLKKDQTLWAWEDSVSAMPKLVVFTKETEFGNRSGTANKPTSDRSGTVNKPTGDHSGTVNKPTGDRTETKTQPVMIRTSPEVSLYPFITMLQPGGQQSIAANNVLPGTKITYTIDDPSIGTVTNVNGIPVLTANKSGQTIVRATTTRAGFPDETTYLLLYVVDGSMMSDTYFTAVRSIPDADKQNSVIVEGLTQAGELVITAASSEKPTPVNGQIVITPELVDRLARNASKAKSAVQQALSENKIVPARELIVNAEILSLPAQNEYRYKLDKNGLVGRKDIDYITVYAGDAKLVFNVATAERLFHSQPVIVIHLVKENNGGYRIQFLDEQGQELSGVSSNIQLILPANYADAAHSSMFYVNGKTKQPIGGKYNPSKNGMEAEINRSGTYLVDDNSKSFPDIDDRDPELKHAVQFLGSKGIVTGKDKGNFEPDSLLTRAEFTAMLVRAFNVMDETAKDSFSDVHPPQWHHPFIASSEKNHIVEGYPDGTFKPDRTISREEMTAIGARFLHERKHYYYPSNPEDYLNQFVDKETISNWAKPTMSLAVKQRLIDVPADKRIKAREAVTRGEAARMLYRLYLQL